MVSIKDCSTSRILHATCLLLAVCEDGSFHKYVFSQDGSCKRETFEKFLDLAEEDDLLCV